MKAKRGIFITGTDTSVGKTYVAAGITKALNNAGIDVGVMKPAETGCRMHAGRLIPADAARLMKSSGAHDPFDLVNPFRFSRPLAPSIAAQLAGKTIAPRKIISAFGRLSRKHDFMIVEGAGGIMVPLSGSYLYLDLAADIRLPVVIVARPGLGTINHTLLTISALKKKRVRIAGVVINYAEDWKKGLAEETNPGVIETLSGVNILGVAGYGNARFDAIMKTLLQSPAVCRGL